MSEILTAGKDVDAQTSAEIEIYNVVGKQGVILRDTHAERGYVRTRWDTSGVAPGVYFYRLKQKTSAGQKDFGLQRLVIVK